MGSVAALGSNLAELVLGQVGEVGGVRGSHCNIVVGDWKVGRL